MEGTSISSKISTRSGAKSLRSMVLDISAVLGNRIRAALSGWIHLIDELVRMN